MRGWVYVLPWAVEGAGRAPVVALDRGLRVVLCDEHDIADEGGEDDTDRDGVSRVDGDRRGGVGAGGDIHIPRASDVLAVVFYHDADSVDSGVEDGGELSKGEKIDKGGEILTFFYGERLFLTAKTEKSSYICSV